MNSPAVRGGGEVARRLAFFKGLQVVTNRIHSATDVDAIINDLSENLCMLFEAERLTIYTYDKESQRLVSQVKTGLNSIKSIRLPVSDASIAGYVAKARKAINIKNVYDTEELAGLSPNIAFFSEVDAHSGFKSREMLAAPIIDPESDALQGVIQLLNSTTGQGFSNILEEGLQGIAQTLGVAFAQRQRAPTGPRSRYEALVIDGRITSAELEETTREAREKGKSVEKVLVEKLGLTLADLGQAASRFFSVPYEPFKNDRVKPMDLLRHIKRDYVEQNRWLPLEETTEGIVIMALDPEQVRAGRIAHNVFPRSKLAFRVTTQRDLEQTVDQMFGAVLDDGSVDDLLLGMEDEDPDAGTLADDVSAAADNELVKLVNKIIIDAYKQGASDIHIEPRPGKEKTLIRFRKDGSLIPYIEVPSSYRNPLVTRIKIMCDLDISERRRPQDGKIKFRKYAPLDIELRVATIPSSGGMEDVVMRVLANSEPIPLDKLGLTVNNHKRILQVLAKPYGIFFVCGPTGSGKTTTLHSILGHINTSDTKIWTAEDPVEITQKGLRQVQVNRKAGLDFAVMMRAFLRADPDVIMVGEMRDKETVSVGIEASLTGHLVFSTLHTNSAPESIVRLLDMGMDPFNFSDALVGVLAQRLAKRLCSKCKVAYHPEQDEIESMLTEFNMDLLGTPAFKAEPEKSRAGVLERWKAEYADKDGRFTFYHPKGCPDCNDGYAGRVGLHELMLGSDPIKRLIQERAKVSELLAEALTDGMRTLRQDGMEKVLSGITDMVQVRKVCVR